MSLVVTGLNHRTAPIEIREKLAFGGADQAHLLEALRQRPSLSEAALLSTCNRTEAYLIDAEDTSIATVRDLFSARLGEDVSRYLYVRRDREAALHLFRVVSGLDSMILGESQIQGQVRDAWESSRETTGAALNRLFQHAQLVGSRVRDETGIGRGAASVSSSAVQLAKKIFGSLNGHKAMVLAMSRLLRSSASGAKVFASRLSRIARTSELSHLPASMAPSRCTTTNAGTTSQASTFSCARRHPRIPW